MPQIGILSVEERNYLTKQLPAYRHFLKKYKKKVGPKHRCYKPNKVKTAQVIRRQGVRLAAEFTCVDWSARHTC